MGMDMCLSLLDPVLRIPPGAEPAAAPAVAAAVLLRSAPPCGLVGTAWPDMLLLFIERGDGAVLVLLLLLLLLVAAAGEEGSFLGSVG